LLQSTDFKWLSGNLPITIPKLNHLRRGWRSLGKTGPAGFGESSEAGGSIAVEVEWRALRSTAQGLVREIEKPRSLLRGFSVFLELRAILRFA
jgi:hypothetical protein